MRLSSISGVILLLLSFSTSSETREYNNLEALSDEDSLDISIYIEPKEPPFLPPSNYLKLTKDKQNLLNECREKKGQLIFFNDFSSFKLACQNALNNGVADAGYILGTSYISGEWTTPDFYKAVDLLEKSSDKGSQLAKRVLIGLYTNPLMPINNRQKALFLAKELELSELDWDIYTSATLHISYGSIDEAKQGFSKLLKLANKGIKKAIISSALAKIMQGPLHNISEAKTLFDDIDISRNNDYAYLPILIDISENKFSDAREKLTTCHKVNSTCSWLYYAFISKGIGGNKDLSQANQILEKAYLKWPKLNANNYAWQKATFLEKPIYNPKEALRAIKNIPEYQKNLAYIKDTIAAVYAANGLYKKAFNLQAEVVAETEGRGIIKNYKNMVIRKKLYSENTRWIEPLEIETFISNVKGFQNIDDTQLELSSI